MKLLFVVNDSAVCINEFANIGYIPPISRRSVEIELTPEQVAKIDIKDLSRGYGRPMMEEIESISQVLLDPETGGEDG